MMTEEEAMKKECLQRILMLDKTGIWALCRGSACMAWRWQIKTINGIPELSSVRGFCGLAGKDGE